MKKRTSTQASTTAVQSLPGLRIKSGVKAGNFVQNHNESQLRIKSGVKAGGAAWNHDETPFAAR